MEIMYSTVILLMMTSAALAIPQYATTRETSAPTTTTSTTRTIIANACIGSCAGKPDGNYPACQPDCESGIFYSCSNGNRYTMDCPLGWYTDSNNNRYLNKMVYNPATDQCLLTSSYCPRNNLVTPPPTTTRTTSRTTITVNGCIGSCTGKPDGNYPACQPDCESGIFYSCVNEYRYTRDCPLGWYTDSYNNQYLNKMVYNPATDQCLLTSSYCPRNNLVPPATTTTSTTRTTITANACIGSCTGKADGNYPACQPDCESGIFYSCVNEYRYTRDCPLGWYTDSNNNQYLNKMVYNPATDQCLLTSSYCPRNNLVTPPPVNTRSTTRSAITVKACISSCTGKPDGNYPACQPDCKLGIFYSCVNGYRYTMDCALGWYIDGNNNRYTAKMVYDPSTDQCVESSSYCPRNL